MALDWAKFADSGRLTDRRTISVGGPAGPGHSAATAAVMTMPATAGHSVATIERRLGTAVARTAGAAGSISSSSSRASPIALSRLRGSFWRHRRSNRRTDGGTSAGSTLKSGSVLSTDARTSEMSSPSNARRPVSISYRTTPNAQMSARLSTLLPFACSGAMYAAVPRIMPICVACAVTVGELIASTRDVPAGSIAFARPKSRTFTVPSARILMFAGLRSR